MKKKIELNALEKEIEAHSSEYRPVAGAKRDRIEKILARSKKTKNINICLLYTSPSPRDRS